MFELEPSPQAFATIATSTLRLTEGLAGLTDAQALCPSGLPGWSRAHVLSHLIAQVWALQRLLTWARTGDRIDQYASRAARDAEIEHGAQRPVAALVDGVVTSAHHLHSALTSLPSAAWDAPILPFTGEVCTPRRILVIRVRELEVHHVDLDLGYSFDDIASPALDVILADVASFLDAAESTPAFVLQQTDGEFRYRHGHGGPTVTGTGGTVIAWLTGRVNGVAPSCTGGVLPRLPAWI